MITALGSAFCLRLKTDGEKRVWRVDIKQRLSPGFIENGGGWGGDVEGDHPILMIIPAKELKREECEGQKTILVVFFWSD